MVPSASKSQGFCRIAAWGAKACEEAIIARMEEIYWGYAGALERGKPASERMHGRYTWAQAAKRFIAICERALDLPVLLRPSAQTTLYSVDPVSIQGVTD